MKTADALRSAIAELERLARDPDIYAEVRALLRAWARGLRKRLRELKP